MLLKTTLLAFVSAAIAVSAKSVRPRAFGSAAHLSSLHGSAARRSADLLTASGVAYMPLIQRERSDVVKRAEGAEEDCDLDEDGDAEPDAKGNAKSHPKSKGKSHHKGKGKPHPKDKEEQFVASLSSVDLLTPVTIGGKNYPAYVSSTEDIAYFVNLKDNPKGYDLSKEPTAKSTGYDWPVPDSGTEYSVDIALGDLKVPGASIFYSSPLGAEYADPEVAHIGFGPPNSSTMGAGKIPSLTANIKKQKLLKKNIYTFVVNKATSGVLMGSLPGGAPEPKWSRSVLPNRMTISGSVNGLDIDTADFDWQYAYITGPLNKATQKMFDDMGLKLVDGQGGFKNKKIAMIDCKKQYAFNFELNGIAIKWDVPLFLSDKTCMAGIVLQEQGTYPTPWSFGGVFMAYYLTTYDYDSNRVGLIDLRHTPGKKGSEDDNTKREFDADGIPSFESLRSAAYLASQDDSAARRSTDVATSPGFAYMPLIRRERSVVVKRAEGAEEGDDFESDAPIQPDAKGSGKSRPKVSAKPHPKGSAGKPAKGSAGKPAKGSAQTDANSGESQHLVSLNWNDLIAPMTIGGKNYPVFVWSTQDICFFDNIIDNPKALDFSKEHTAKATGAVASGADEAAEYAVDITFGGLTIRSASVFYSGHSGQKPQSGSIGSIGFGPPRSSNLGAGRIPSLTTNIKNQKLLNKNIYTFIVNQKTSGVLMGTLPVGSPEPTWVPASMRDRMTVHGTVNGIKVDDADFDWQYPYITGPTTGDGQNLFKKLGLSLQDGVGNFKGKKIAKVDCNNPPMFTFVFGEATLNYNIPMRLSDNSCIAGIVLQDQGDYATPWTFGAIFMSNYLTTYNYDTDMVGFIDLGFIKAKGGKGGKDKRDFDEFGIPTIESLALEA